MLGKRGIPVLLCEADPVTVEDFRIVFAKPKNDAVAGEEQSLEAVLMQSLADDASDPGVDLHVYKDGHAALAAARRGREERDPFQVAFIDLGSPPDYWGLDTAEEMRALDPALHIVLMVSRLETEPAALFARVPPADRLSVCRKPLHGFEIGHLVSAAVARRRFEPASSRNLAVLNGQPTFEQAYPDTESLNEALALLRRALAALISQGTTRNRRPSQATARGTRPAAMGSAQMSLGFFDNGSANSAALELAESTAAFVEVLDASLPKVSRPSPRKQPTRT